MPVFELTVLITHSPHPEDHVESLGHAQVLVRELNTKKNPVSMQSVFYTPPDPSAPAASTDKTIQENFNDIMRILNITTMPAADKSKSYSVSYGYDRTAGTNLPSVIEKVKKKIAESGGDGAVSVTLYSNVDKSLEEFHKEINEAFSLNDFNIDTNNCADAVNYTLNYFFPRSKKLESLVTDLEWKMPKLASTPLCLLNLAACVATCTMIPLTTTSVFTTAPDDLLKKVKLLESFYGKDAKDDENVEVTLDKSKGPQRQDPVWKGENPKWREQKEKEKSREEANDPAEQKKRHNQP